MTKEQLLQNDIVKEIAIEFIQKQYSKLINPEYAKNEFEEYKNSIIKKPEWEILSYQRKEGVHDIWTPNSDYPVIGTPIEIYWNIHSVKRLSDNEIFTIGDKVSFYGKLVKIIKISPDEFYSGNLWLHYMSETHREYTLLLKRAVKWTEKPLFISSDNVEIFEGDTVYYSSENKIYDFKANNANIISYNPLFSTKQKAEEFLINNAKVLSLNDIDKYIKEYMSKSSIELIVKERLNLK